MALVVASVSGNNGAGILIPLMMGLYHFDAKSAVGISNASLSVGGLLRYMYNLRESHPLKNGKGVVIDYNFVVLGLPSAIIGISLGSIVNFVLPSIIILGIFIAVTILNLHHSIKAYCKIRRSEQSALRITSACALESKVDIHSIGKELELAEREHQQESRVGVRRSKSMAVLSSESLSATPASSQVECVMPADTPAKQDDLETPSNLPNIHECSGPRESNQNDALSEAASSNEVPCKSPSDLTVCALGCSTERPLS